MFNAKVYTVSIPSSGVALEEEHIAREVIARWNVEADFIKETLDAGLYKHTTRITSSILLQTSDIVHRTMVFLHI